MSESEQSLTSAFQEYVRRAFLFLEEEYGYRHSAPIPVAVRYDSGVVFLVVY
jgi:hypothetical protein